MSDCQPTASRSAPALNEQASPTAKMVMSLVACARPDAGQHNPQHPEAGDQRAGEEREQEHPQVVELDHRRGGRKLVVMVLHGEGESLSWRGL